MRYGSWDMEWETKCFVILGHFLPFYPPSPPPQPGNQNSAKMKKASGDVIILHMCTKNHNHIWCMLYEIWSAIDIVIFCNFGSFFALLPFNPKNQSLKKNKKMPGNVIILENCTINNNYMMYGSSDMKRKKHFFAILGHFLPFYPPKNKQIVFLQKKNPPTNKKISFF